MDERKLKEYLIVRKAVLQEQVTEKNQKADPNAYNYAKGQLKAIEDVIAICEKRKRY